MEFALPCLSDVDRLSRAFYDEGKGRLVKSFTPFVPAQRKATPPPLSADELKTIIAKHLPAWLSACAADTEVIVMHEEAFGTSGGELFLFGCAIKYAAQTGKIVHVTCGREGEKATPGTVFPTHVVDAVYRERGVSSARLPRQRRKA